MTHSVRVGYFWDVSLASSPISSTTASPTMLSITVRGSLAHSKWYFSRYSSASFLSWVLSAARQGRLRRSPRPAEIECWWWSALEVLQTATRSLAREWAQVRVGRNSPNRWKYSQHFLKSWVHDRTVIPLYMQHARITQQHCAAVPVDNFSNK